MQRTVFVNKKNHALTAAILGLVSSVVNGVSGIVPVSLAKRENTKNHLKTILYSPVYLSGKSLDYVKAALSRTYKNNPALFEQYYNEYYQQRLSDLEAGVHPSQSFFTPKMILMFVLIVIVIIFAILVFKKGGKK
jgi:hypothetical protein